MTTFTRGSVERVNAFPVNSTYMFKHYFDQEDVFDYLKQHYNNQYYRFEIPESEINRIREFLSEYDYGLVLVDQTEEFAVLVQRYHDHPDNIFKDSVVQRNIGEYNCFLMSDQAAVEQAVTEGATRVTETDLNCPF